MKTQEEFQAEAARLEERVASLESALAQSFGSFSVLQEREERYRLLVENLPDAAWTMNSAGGLIYISPQVEKVYGYRPEEILAAGGDLWFGRIHPEDRGRVQGAFEQLLTRGGALDSEYRIQHRNGFWIWLHDRAFARSTKEGRRLVHGVFRDVTAHKSADRELRIKDAAVESSLNGIIIGDLSGVITYANASFLRLWGYERPDEVIGRSGAEFAQIPDEVRRIFATLREQQGWSGELSARRKDGSLMPVQMTASLVRDREGKPFCLMATFQDITERKHAEEDRHRSQEQAQLLIDRMPVGCIMWDPAFRVALWNPMAERIFGYPAAEALGMSGRQLIASEASLRKVEELWQGLLSGDDVAHNINENRGRDGRTIICEWFNTPIRDASGKASFILSMVMDVTDRQRAEEERRKLEGQLQQSQKMEAIGLLAGGVAHDFNNILSAILGYASIVQMKMREDDPLRPNVEQVLAASKRAASLTQSLLAFSRKQIISPQPLLVNESLKKIERLLRRIIGEDIEFTSLYAEPDLTVLVDAGQLEQAIINLATNARDAMPDGGAITIATRRIDIDGEFVARHGYGKPGAYAMILMSDTGIGMDEKTRTRIFEPFFTTKELGKGTGLGLSTAYGVVKQNNGYITCDSEPGAGATFRIYLPLIDAGKRGPEDAPAPLAGRGTETILLAEDDQTMRDLYRSLIADHGYTVIAATDGEEAIAKFRERPHDIQLLVLDVVMPKKNGKEVYDEARRIRPNVKTLFISGYNSDMVKQKGILETGMNFLPKPATPAELLTKVREILDEK